MNEIGREIFKNVYSTMKECHYSATLNSAGKVTDISIVAHNPDPVGPTPNLKIYIKANKFSRISPNKSIPANALRTEIESLLTGKVVKDAILEIFMPVVSFNTKENGINYVASAYAAVRFSFTRSFGFSPLIGGTLLMKITSGLDNSISLCTDNGSSKVMLLTSVQEILYKKEDILEYLI